MNEAILDLVGKLIDRSSGKLAPPAPCLHRIPVESYTSEEHFDREWRGLFSNRPLLLCHESELANEGQALVHDKLGLPLISVRTKSGRVATYMNVCRHRGMRLVQETGFQNLRSLICPYHQWTYGLDGELRNVPCEGDFEGLQKSELGLIELPTEVRHGLVWLQLTPQGKMNLDDHLQELGDDLDAFGVNTAVAYTNNTRTLACNWKLVHDAFLDGYHVVRLHKNTVGPYFPDNLAVSNTVGIHTRSTVGRNEVLEVGNLPREEWNPRTLCTFAYTLLPNAIVIMHPDYTSLVTLFPKSASETVLSHTMLLDQLPTTEKARAHFDKSFQLIDQGVFQAEDIFVCEGAQKGMTSGANRELLLGANEISVKLFHDTVEAEITRQ
ncbi:MAG: aromatic ring-hydroxylating dioxygenase subunit alpha [Pseudomonadales bacterium]